MGFLHISCCLLFWGGGEGFIRFFSSLLLMGLINFFIFLIRFSFSFECYQFTLELEFGFVCLLVFSLFVSLLMFWCFGNFVSFLLPFLDLFLVCSFIFVRISIDSSTEGQRLQTKQEFLRRRRRRRKIKENWRRKKECETDTRTESWGERRWWGGEEEEEEKEGKMPRRDAGMIYFVSSPRC